MVSYSLEALGSVIQELRDKRGWTQEELGRRVGYRGGAGVTISRIENGNLNPPQARLLEIARVLDVGPDELLNLAKVKTGASMDAGDRGDAIEDRVAEISRESDRRTKLLTTLDEFCDARDRAASDFLARFCHIAARVEGTSVPDLAELVPLGLVGGDGPAAESTYQLLFTRIGVATTLARSARSSVFDESGDAWYASFVEEVKRGAVTTGATILAGTSGTAAISGLGAAMRMSESATPAAVAVDIAVRIGKVTGELLGKLTGVAVRNRKRQLELAADADNVAATMRRTQPGVLAVTEFIPRATMILDYIAVHAGHALSRWEGQLGADAIEWQSLSAQHRRRYDDFVQIAAAQLAVASISPNELILRRGADLDRDRALIDALLSQTLEVVTARV